MKPNYLFRSTEFNDYVRNRVLSMQTQIHKLSADDFKKSTIEELVDRYYADYQLVIPDLKTADIFMRKPEDLE